jgi:hypothetical protein
MTNLVVMGSFKLFVVVVTTCPTITKVTEPEADEESSVGVGPSTNVVGVAICEVAPMSETLACVGVGVAPPDTMLPVLTTTASEFGSKGDWPKSASGWGCAWSWLTPSVQLEPDPASLATEIGMGVMTKQGILLI